MAGVQRGREKGKSNAKCDRGGGWSNSPNSPIRALCSNSPSLFPFKRRPHRLGGGGTPLYMLDRYILDRYAM